MTDIRNKTAVVTGAASGIGRALGIGLAREGARVVLADLNQAGLAESAKLVEAAGAKAETYALDVSSRDAVQSFADDIEAKFGGADIVINNAGVTQFSKIEDLSYEDFEWIMNIDFWGVVICVAAMSISSMFYIIGGQYLIAKLWHLVPISGYSGGTDALRFVLLPAAVGVVAGFGGSTRLYRAFFLEEISKDYVRTARAKGLSESVVLFRHVLKNAMIPILTGVVVAIPFLFIGGLITESFFGIPGLGSYTIDAINSQDFAVVRSMVFIGSLLYIAGLLLTDISYTLVDPRVRLS